MGFNVDSFDVSQLNVDERISLIGKLWDSVEEEIENIPLTDEQMEEINNRIKAYESGEMKTSSWEDVKKRLNIT